MFQVTISASLPHQRNGFPGASGASGGGFLLRLRAECARGKKRAAIVLAPANARRETMARYMMSFHIGYYVASGNTNQHFAGVTLTRYVFRSDLDLLRGLPTPARV